MRGRDKELDVALGLIRAAEAGRGGVLLVEGEPGIGKTRFLEETATAATARGFTVSWGQADARTVREVHAPDAAPGESLARARRAAGSAGDGLLGWRPPAGRTPAGTALGGRDGRALVVLDDLQCAGRAGALGAAGPDAARPDPASALAPGQEHG